MVKFRAIGDGKTAGAVYSALVQILETIALISFLAEDKNNTPVFNLIKKSLPLILPLWWLIAIQGLIITGGTFLFIIPGLIFFVWFTFSYNLLILENIRGVNALFISRELVKERFWAIVERIIIIGVITFALAFILNITPYILSILVNPQSFSFSEIIRGLAPQKFSSEPLIMVILNFIVKIVKGSTVTPFALIFYILLYKNAKQLYAKSYPLPSKKSRFLLLLPILVIILLFVLLPVLLLILVVFDPLKRFKPSKINYQIPTVSPTINNFPFPSLNQSPPDSATPSAYQTPFPIQSNSN